MSEKRCTCPDGHGQMTYVKCGGPLVEYWVCPVCEIEKMWPDTDDTPPPPKSAYALRHQR